MSEPNEMPVDEINKIPVMKELRNEFRFSLVEAKKVADVVLNEIDRQQEEYRGSSGV